MSKLVTDGYSSILKYINGHAVFVTQTPEGYAAAAIHHTRGRTELPEIYLTPGEAMQAITLLIAQLPQFGHEPPQAELAESARLGSIDPLYEPHAQK